MMWPENVEVFLANGGAGNFHLATIVSPFNLTTQQTETFAFWTGHEEITLDLDGPRSMIPTYGALDQPDPRYSAGTDIRTHTAKLFGLSSAARTLLQSYDLRKCEAENWQLCFTQGAVFLGGRRRFKGVVDRAPRVIGTKGASASLEIEIVSGMRSGTQTSISKKSHASYQLRDGDTGMEYASLTDVEGDIRGSK